MTADLKNQTKIGAKFIFRNFSEIKTFYSAVMRNTNIQYGTKKEIQLS